MNVEQLSLDLFRPPAGQFPALVGSAFTPAAGPFIFKQCPKCKIEKPMIEFRKSWCKKCHNEYNKAWRITHFKNKKTHSHEWYIEKSKTHGREWYRANKERALFTARIWRSAHSARWRALRNKWKAKNPNGTRAIRLRHRALKHNAPGFDYTTAQHIAWRWEMWGNKCYICSGPATATDHVIPLSKSGSHFPANLRPICTSCNGQKHAQALDKFLKARKL